MDVIFGPGPSTHFFSDHGFHSRGATVSPSERLPPFVTFNVRGWPRGEQVQAQVPAEASCQLVHAQCSMLQVSVWR